MQGGRRRGSSLTDSTNCSAEWHGRLGGGAIFRVDASDRSEGDDSISRNQPPSDGAAVWGWVYENYLMPAVIERFEAGKLEGHTEIRRVQVVFRLGSKPLIRLDGEVRGREVIEPRPALGPTQDPDGFREQNVASVELSADESALGHVTAILTGASPGITVRGVADTDSITHELDGATRYIRAAVRLLGDPKLPDDPLYDAFADAAHTAAEMLARAELYRLPDHRPLNSHRTVRARYHLWAKAGHSELRFPRLLDSTAHWQRDAKYDRAKFSLTPAQAADCIQALREMQRHAEHRPRRTLSLPVRMCC